MVGEAREYVLKKNEMEKVLRRIKEKYNFKEMEKTKDKIYIRIYKVGGWGGHEIIVTTSKNEARMRIKADFLNVTFTFGLGMFAFFLYFVGPYFGLYLEPGFGFCNPFLGILVLMGGPLLMIMGVIGFILLLMVSSDLTKIIDEIRKKR
jgi:hypothetical protein